VNIENSIPIIDIFAGPGGLGEGFSAAKSAGGKPVFKIKLSIEKDEFAHKTLELRAFYRQFSGRSTPKEYYDYLKGAISRTDLFWRYEEEAAQAKKEAWHAELGVVPDEVVDARISEALDNAKDWILIGGPPCQAYSLVGRSRMIGEDKGKYETDPRHFLYKQYLRILAAHQPPVFVMENVKGFLSPKLHKQKTFDLILADLRNPSKAIEFNTGQPLSYKLFSFSQRRSGSEELNPEDFVVRSEEYGIPQTRHRIIIFGIRSDFYQSEPAILPKSEPISIEQVIDDLPKLRSGISKEKDSAGTWEEIIKSFANVQWLKTLDDSLKERILGEINEIGETSAKLSRGKQYMPVSDNPKKHKEWYIDPILNGVCNHETRIHIREDLHRYLFASLFAREYGRTPKLKNFPVEFLPKHVNVYEALSGSKFNDRFRVQVRGKPSTTVVSHISKDGHYFIHYDPSQCRSLTVRETARLQTFPDNYFFEGSRTDQYRQVGNAVPPLLAFQIARIVSNTLKNLE
jgi:DNA (cytosine-5)-methyltransferase 1